MMFVKTRENERNPYPFTTKTSVLKYLAVAAAVVVVVLGNVLASRPGILEFKSGLERLIFFRTYKAVDP
jgi:hypothetical protein